jgi:hypothetical protein
MAATREDVDRWIRTAKKMKCKFIISVCDTFDWDDYPVYCKDYTELIKEYDSHNGTNMQKINEIIEICKDGTIREDLRLNEIVK